MLVLGLCVSKYVGVLMRFEWWSLGVGVGGCYGVWVEWMSEFYTSGIVYNTYNKHEYRVLNSIWPKSGLSEFWKKKNNTLFK